MGRRKWALFWHVPREAVMYPPNTMSWLSVIQNDCSASFGNQTHFSFMRYKKWHKGFTALEIYNSCTFRVFQEISANSVLVQRVCVDCMNNKGIMWSMGLATCCMISFNSSHDITIGY